MMMTKIIHGVCRDAISCRKITSIQVFMFDAIDEQP